MPESVQNNQSKGSMFAQTLVQEAKMAAVGAVGGVAAGAAAGAIIPASKKNIAYQIADKFVKENDEIKQNIDILEKLQNNEIIKKLIEALKNDKDDKNALKGASELLEGADCDKKQIIKELEGKIDKSVKGLDAEEVAKHIDDLFEAAKDKASDIVKNFYKLSSSQRKKDANFDLIKSAKKCAKSAQIEKYAGTGLFAGVLVLLFTNLFKSLPQKEKTETKSKLAPDSKLQTTQG